MGVKENVRVELLYSVMPGVSAVTWHDITSDVLSVYEPITITRGRQSEARRIAPTRLQLSLKNSSGTYSPRNPMSTLYGKIGRNTKIRVGVGSLAASGSAGFWRCHCEVESWPQEWTLDATEGGSRGLVKVPLNAYGIFRRLGGAGTKAPTSDSIRRYMATQSPRAYWPMDAGQNSTQGLAVTDDTEAMAMTFAAATSTARWAGSSLAPWLSDVLAYEGASVLAFGTVPGAAPSTSIAYDFVVRNRNAGDSAQVNLKAYHATVDSSNNWQDYYVQGNYASGSPNMDLVRANSGGTASMDTADATTAAAVWDDTLHYWRLLIEDSGANVNVTVYLDGEIVLSGTHNSVQLTGGSAHYTEVAHSQSGAFGHSIVWVDFIPSVDDVYDAIRGYEGETANERLERLCSEETITYTLDATQPQVTGMFGLGPQRAISVLDSMFEAADADGGILYETRDSFGVTFTPLMALYNQTVAASFDYTDGDEIAPGLEASEDTNAISNDVTVKRQDGGSTRLVQDSGILNVNEPEDDVNGVGRYAVSVTLNLETDDQLLQQAAWKRHLGTWDDARYPTITVDLTALSAAGKTSLLTDVVELDLGSRVQIENMPVWTGPDDVDQLDVGYVETIGSHRRLIRFATVPAGPYTVGVLNSSSLGRLDSATSTLTSGISSTATSLSVTFTGTRWVTTASEPTHLPFDIRIGGEVMTVTAVTATTSPQTFTVTRSVNGVVKSHSAGAEVRLAQPLRLARR